jgi:hypothetical protein
VTSKKIRKVVNGHKTTDGDNVLFNKEGSRYFHNLLPGDFIYIPTIGLYEIKIINKNYVEFNSNIRLINTTTDKPYYRTLFIKALNKSRISLKMLQDLNATIEYCAHKIKSKINSTGAIEVNSKGSLIKNV